MLHPQLQQHLEQLGANIEPQPNGDTHVYVPGADRQWKFTPNGEVHRRPATSVGSNDPFVVSPYMSMDVNHVYNPDGHDDLRFDADDTRQNQESVILNDLAGHDKTLQLPNSPYHLKVGQRAVPDEEGGHRIGYETTLRDDIKPIKNYFGSESPTAYHQGHYWGIGKERDIHPETAALARAAIHSADPTPLHALLDHLIEHHTQQGHSNYCRAYNKALSK